MTGPDAGILRDDIRSVLDVVRGVVSDLKSVEREIHVSAVALGKLEQLPADVREIKGDLVAVQQAVAKQNSLPANVADQEKRIGRLEQSSAKFAVWMMLAAMAASALIATVLHRVLGK